MNGEAKTDNQFPAARGPEEAVGRNETTQAAMHALEVVVIDKQADSLAGFCQVGEDGRLQQLAPQRAPKAFDLFQRLRTPQPGHDLLDAALLGGR